MAQRKRGAKVSSSKCHHSVSLDYGVLDLVFPPTGSDEFAVAASTGKVDLFALDESSLEVSRKHSFTVCDETILVLQLAWRPVSVGESTFKVAMALSDGRIAILSFSSDTYFVYFISSHSLEVWFVTWDNVDHDIIYSGGDDSCFCVSRDPVDVDPNMAEKVQDGIQETDMTKFVPFYRNAKIHGAGVTSILHLAVSDHGDRFVMTGSYDEHLRILRQQEGRLTWEVVLVQLLGGGIWRLKTLCGSTSIHETIRAGWSRTILASCMHAGPRIVQIQLSEQYTWSAKLLAIFAEHKSMNYASDISKNHDPARSEKTTIASSSFYDKKLCLWSTDSF